MEYTTIVYIIIIYTYILHHLCLGPIHVIHIYFMLLLFKLRLVQRIILYILVNPHVRILITKARFFNCI